jgi:hypothetical protein
LANPACAMHQHFIEPSILWQIGITVTQMPFAKQSGGVASLL